MSKLVIDVQESGAGRPALVVHGGGGPQTVAPLVSHLAETMHVLAPTLPGWDGTPRPESVTSIADIARGLVELLSDRDLRDVLVVGSSIGGWVAADMATGDSEGRIGAIVLVDSMGIEVPEQPMTDFFALSPREIVEHSFADPDRFFVDPATLSDAQRETQAANIASLRAVAGDPYMHDPTLLVRLADVAIPVLVIWGDHDRIATPDYGRAFAAALPDARFELVARAGHLPQLEQPAATFGLIDAFV